MALNKDISAAARKARIPDRLEALLAHLGDLLPADERPAFRRLMLEPPAPSLRLNPLHPCAPALRRALLGRARPVPWCADAFELDGDAPPLGRCLEHLLGGFYVQAKATTLAVEALGPQPGHTVLDMAAAPGGKTTQIAAAMRNTGLLLANDSQRSRLPALVGNIERCGVANTVVSHAPGAMLARHFDNFFDRVLLDAPCSGDGIVNKNLGMLRYWSPEEACNKGNQQKGLLRAAFHMLKPGGIMVYSTCSLSLEENEDVLAGLMHKYPGQVEFLPVEGIESAPLPPGPAAPYPEALQRVVRVWPHRHTTEGACLARIRKNGETQWPKGLQTAAWTVPPPAPPAPEAEDAARHLSALWGMDTPLPAGSRLDHDGKYLVVWPEAAPSLKESYPYFLRGGLRLAKRHREHYYLTQQGAGLWGDRARAPALELDWEQTRRLFAGRTLHLAESQSLRGEALCRFGEWTLCRGAVAEGGRTFAPHLPKSMRNEDLCRLV